MPAPIANRCVLWRYPEFESPAMKFPLAALLILLAVEPVMAETCHEQFVRLYTDLSEKGPMKNYVVSEIKGQKPSKGYHYSDGTRDWMTQTIEPDNLPWSMVRGQNMYASYDKGKSWKKIRELDAGHSDEAIARQLEAAAKTVKNAACGTEELSGVMHATVEADYEQPAFKTSHHDKFWIDPASGFIVKSTSRTSQAGFESFVTQVIERVPDLKLPDPK